MIVERQVESLRLCPQPHELVVLDKDRGGAWSVRPVFQSNVPAMKQQGTIFTIEKERGNVVVLAVDDQPSFGSAI